MSSLNLPWYSFEPFACVLLLDTSEKRSALSTSTPQEAGASNEVTSKPPFFQTRKAQSLVLLFTGHAFQPFHQFVALLWKHPSAFTSFLNCGAQNCTQYSR